MRRRRAALDLCGVDVPPSPTSPGQAAASTRVVALLADERLRDEMLRAASGSPGLSIDPARSVEDAVALVRDERPDAVLVEIVDPVDDLRGLSELVVGAGGAPAPLLLTGMADRALVGALRRAGLFARALPADRDAAAICGALLEMSRQP
jgi:hypothetical protein